MHLLQIVEPGVDGVFRHVEGLCHFLLQRGHKVSLAYSSVRGSDRLGTLVREVAAGGGAVLDLHVSNGPHPRDVRALIALRQLFGRRRPDAIHAHSSKAGVLGRTLPWLGIRQPIFYTPNAYFGMGAQPGLRTWVFNTVERIYGRVGTTLNVSADEAAFARERLGVPAARQQIVPNAVDTAEFRPGDAAARARLRAEAKVGPDSLLLGTVGRLSYQKDPLTLYRAMIPVLAAEPRLHLVHLGKGDLETEADRIIADAGLAGRIIRFPYRADPAEFYAGLDAFALTSRYEGLSFAVLEALATGLPLILSDVPGNREFLRLGLSHCWSAAPEVPAGFTAAIGQWLADRPAERASNHRATAEERFSFEACYGTIERLYAEAAAVARV